MMLSAACLALCLAAAAAEPSPESPSATAASTESVTVSLTAVGDIRLDGPVGEILAKGGISAPFSGLGDSLRADILLGNLECPLTKRGTKQPKTWTFRAPPKNLAALKAAGFNILTIANNHVLDYGPDGIFDTLAELRRSSIPFIGGGKDLEEAQKLEILEVHGLRVGFLGFTSTFPEEAWARRDRPGVAYSELSRVKAAIEAARPRCDMLAVVFHGGTELAPEPNDIQKEFAHLAIDSGADIIIGHHPHVVQPLEIYKGKPIIYSLGNFLFVSPNPATRPTIAARTQVSAKGVEGIEFLPFDTNWGRPVPASDEQRGSIAATLDRYGALTAEPAKYRLAPR
ncbi:MAG: CapA family protein [Elusimicrobiota bacterium]|jgi:poly-gamma-glutamate synthesis protein (capsule biosynthesis protein)